MTTTCGIVQDLEFLHLRHPSGRNSITTATLNTYGMQRVHKYINDTTNSNIHVLALQETRTISHIDNADWVTWFAPGTVQKGGVAIAIHHTLFARQTRTRDSITALTIGANAIGVTLDLLNIGTVTFISVYVPQPHQERPAFIRKLLELTNPLTHTVI